MASYKKPREVEFVDEIPRTNGQVDYDALHARVTPEGAEALVEELRAVHP